MKIQEYKTRIRYIGFQWNGESVEDVRKTIRKIEDYFSVSIPYTLYAECHYWKSYEFNQNVWKISFRPKTINLPVLFANKKTHILISDAGGVRIVPESQVDNRFNIIEWEEAK